MTPADDQPPDPIHLNKTDARQGTTPRMTRYVVTIGIALVIVGFAIVWMMTARQQ